MRIAVEFRHDRGHRPSPAGQVLALAALVVAVCAVTARGSTYTVLACNPIQPVINAAQDGDVIILGQGTHFQHINFLGKSITVRSANPETDASVAATILNGAGGVGPMVTFENGEDSKAVLYGITIRNGTGKLDAGFVSGGGLFIKNTSPTIWRCVITSNTAVVGAGVYINGGAPLLERNFIHHNTASTSGGGLRITTNSLADILTNLITGNRSNTPGGAGIDVLNCLASAPVIRHNVIAGNYAGAKGSAVSCSSASPSVFDNVCAFNRGAGAGAGALYSEGGGAPFWCYNDAWTNIPTNYGAGVILCAVGSIALNPIFANPGFWSDVNGTPGNLSDDLWVDGDYHIGAGSPCIDSGLWTSPWPPPWVDYANLARLRDDRCAANTGQTISLPVDIGAYEYIDPGAGTISTYVGPAGGTWFLAANWSNGIPTCNTAATIPISMQIPAGNAVADDVNVVTGGTPMDIQIGANLTTNRGMVANGGAAGLVRQFGGNVRFANNLNISVFPQTFAPRPGTWELRGGTLSVTDLNAGFGSPSDGRIIQTGGACTVNGTLTLGQGPQIQPNPLGGRYELHNGTLTTNHTILGGSGETPINGVGLMIVDSPTASWTNSTFLAVGGSESIGTLQISNGGDVTALGSISMPSGEGTGLITVGGAGSTLNAGAINVSTGPIFASGLLDVFSGGHVMCTSMNNGGNCGATTTGIGGATVRVSGAGSRLDCGGLIELGGQRPSASIVIGTKARLEANAGGVIAATQVINYPFGEIRGSLGTIDANVINLGEISPGGIGASSFGTLTIDGSLSQVGQFSPACGTTLEQRAGKVIIDLGGAPASSRDLLNISGALLGGGALDVRLVGGFNPAIGSSFVIGTYQQLIQPFALVTTTNMGSDRFLRVTYQPSALAGGGGSIVVTVVPMTALIAFNPPQSLSLGGLPRDLTLGDFDQEDGPDVAVCVPGTAGPNELPGDVFVLLNNGTTGSGGTWLGFSLAVQVAVGRGPVSIATGDFDSLNGPDMVVANQGDDDISILRNNGQLEGAASFTRIDIPTPDQPISVASADINGDTRDDVLYGNLGAFNANTGVITINGTISYLIAIGGGGFGAPVVRPAGVRPSVIDPANVDNDRDIDVIALSTLPQNFGGGLFTEGGNLTVLRNTDGAGNLASADFYTVNGTAQGMSHGDLDNDMLEDFTVGNTTGNGITYFRNAGEALFEGGVLAPLNGDPNSHVAVDFDGDGDLDIAATVDTGASNELQVLPNLLDGGGPNALQFGPPFVPDVGGEPLLVDTGDVDGDQSIDLIVITDDVALAGGGGGIAGGAEGAPASARVLVNALEACIGDTNGSGTVDVDDLISVILHWGPCPAPPAPCPGNTNGSTAVDVDDLIAVILHWGACP